MKIICPECGHEFNWEPPEDKVIYKMLTPKDLKKRKPNIYLAKCPKCKAPLRIQVGGEENLW